MANVLVLEDEEMIRGAKSQLGYSGMGAARTAFG